MFSLWVHQLLFECPSTEWPARFPSGGRRIEFGKKKFLASLTFFKFWQTHSPYISNESQISQTFWVVYTVYKISSQCLGERIVVPPSRARHSPCTEHFLYSATTKTVTITLQTYYLCPMMRLFHQRGAEAGFWKGSRLPRNAGSGFGIWGAQCPGEASSRGPVCGAAGGLPAGPGHGPKCAWQSLCGMGAMDLMWITVLSVYNNYSGWRQMESNYWEIHFFLWLEWC